ncbi:NAD(P)/FAD-dependent oxidoreductase [Muricoccus radiodurans]|uniref:NAD(P)/FAD-dependent oxidoreductase n=1 Tax=Muricoccus radiodurans TaxID=2231721 RepID=UPI003CF5D36D
MSRAIVIGGGLHGMSTALHLARMGWSVTLLERRHVGRHSSGINAGGVRRMGRDVREIGLSVASAEMWADIKGLVGDDCGFVANGQFKVAENEADLKKAEARVAEVRALGWTHEEVVDRDELRRLIPAVAPHAMGALATRDDGAADPMRTVMAFRRACVEAGVDLREGIAVKGLDRAPGGGVRVDTDAGPMEAERVANCAGAWAFALAESVGEKVPGKAKASMMIVTERVEPFCAPTVGAMGRALSFKQSAAGTVVIGGGHQGRNDIAMETSTVLFASLAKAAVVATELFPIMRGVKMVRSWCGIEAMPPDQIPVIGESATLPGLFHSFGYSGHGFQLAPAAGRAVAELMARGGTNLPIGPFTQARFSQAVAA